MMTTSKIARIVEPNSRSTLFMQTGIPLNHDDGVDDKDQKHRYRGRGQDQFDRYLFRLHFSLTGA